MPTSESDPFACFDCTDSESDGDEKNTTNEHPNGDQGPTTELDLGRRLAQAINARQSNASIDHLPLPSPDYEIFSCQDEVGFGKGQMGFRALKHFSAGDEILRESPTMRVRTAHPATSREEANEKFESAVAKAFGALSPRTQAAVMDLSQQKEGDKTPQGIFQTNCYQLGDEVDFGGLFLTVARMNHSCRPNGAHHWRPDLHMMVVHASRDIEVGEEIMTSYGPSDWRDTEARRSYLRSRYTFDCRCDMCCEGNEMGGDDRMVELGDFYDKISPYMATGQDQEEAIQIVDHCLQLLTDQGLGNATGPDVKSLLHYGYQISLAGLHDNDRAHSYLKRELLAVNSTEGRGSYKSLDIQRMLNRLDGETETRLVQGH